jgi:hypothetical protein
MTVVGDGVFRDLSISGSDREWSSKVMGFDAMLSDKHPMDESGGCAAINNSSGLKLFVRVYRGKDGCQDP